jgi:ribosomal protein L6P/L9E
MVTTNPVVHNVVTTGVHVNFVKELNTVGTGPEATVTYPDNLVDFLGLSLDKRHASGLHVSMHIAQN